MDACAFEVGARRRNRYLDFEALRTNLEMELQCVFSEKHYFNSVENPHAQNDYHAKLQRLGWIPHLFPYKTMRRNVAPGGSPGDSIVKYYTVDGVPANALAGTYEITVQAGVDSALVTAMSLLHSRAPTDAVFVLIASDGDFHSTLSLLKDSGRAVYVVFWGPDVSGPDSNNPLAAGLTNFLKQKPRQPGEAEKYVFLDEILTETAVASTEAKGAGKSNGYLGKTSGGWDCAKCGFANKSSNSVCGGTGPMGCKAERPPEVALEWACICGFKNKTINDVCGGKGQMGCKKPKPGPAPPGVWAAVEVERAADWTCACGFVNKPFNEICGGKGQMGCKAPRPEPEFQ